MKRIKLNEATSFRGADLQDNEVCELPDGVAFKLIAQGKADIVSDDTPLGVPVSIEELAETEDLNELTIAQLKEVCVYLEIDTTGVKLKDGFISLIEAER